jgi:hypothetical protein
MRAVFAYSRVYQLCYAQHGGSERPVGFNLAIRIALERRAPSLPRPIRVVLGYFALSSTPGRKKYPATNARREGNRLRS